jgi:hypothetical protein
MRVERESMSNGWVVKETRALANILPPSAEARAERKRPQ